MSDDKDETLLEFPCEFPIKMMGRDVEGFRATAIALIESHTGTISEDAITTSASSKGNFVSVTVTITAESQEQLDNIYRELTSHDDILVAL
jgi:putative lipoic acid-binding regulatory protein